MKITFDGTMSEYLALFGPGGTTREVPSSEIPTQEVPTQGVPETNFPLSCEIPVPLAKADSVKLPHISENQQILAGSMFREFCLAWSVGFGKEGEDQPDRVQLMKDFGSGAHVIPVLVMAYEMESLQRLVEKALVSLKSEHTEDWLDWIDRIAANMVQVSHIGFPELSGTYDYSKRWRRSE